jgi:hypothetical protein
MNLSLKVQSLVVHHRWNTRVWQGGVMMPTRQQPSHPDRQYLPYLLKDGYLEQIDRVDRRVRRGMNE